MRFGMLSTVALLVVQHFDRATGLRTLSSICQTVRPAVAVSSVAGMSKHWYDARVVSSRSESEGIRVVDIEVPSPVISMYKNPGQYVRVGNREKDILLSIASPPDGRSVLTFLIKEIDSHKNILELQGGEALKLSVPEGAGFPVQRCLADSAVRNILLVACGSGLAPIAAAIESGQLGLGGEGGRRTRLYLGVRTPSHLPLASSLPSWERSGVEVVPVFSRSKLGSAGTQGESWTQQLLACTGSTAAALAEAREGCYVQDALSADGVQDPMHTVALLCGMRAMTDRVRALLLEAGVPGDRILLNY